MTHQAKKAMQARRTEARIFEGNKKAAARIENILNKLGAAVDEHSRNLHPNWGDMKKMQEIEMLLYKACDQLSVDLDD